MDTKECTPATDKGILRIERYLSRLDQLDDIVFAALEGQAELLRIEVKGRSGVVVHIEV